MQSILLIRMTCSSISRSPKIFEKRARHMRFDVRLDPAEIRLSKATQRSASSRACAKATRSRAPMRRAMDTRVGLESAGIVPLDALGESLALAYHLIAGESAEVFELLEQMTTRARSARPPARDAPCVAPNRPLSGSRADARARRSCAAL